MSIQEKIDAIYPENPSVKRSLRFDAQRYVALSDQCDALLKQGREKEGAIFLSKFNPVFNPPDFLWPVKQAENEAWQRLGDTADQHVVNGEMLRVARESLPELPNGTAQQYRSRFPFGIPELQANLSRWLADQSITYGDGKASCFTCTNSVNGSLLVHLFQKRESEGLFSDGRCHEVVFFTPTYGIAPRIAHKEGLKIQVHSTSPANHYKPTADDIDRVLNRSRTPYTARAISLVNPGNPMGSYFSREEIEQIADVVVAHNKKRARKGIPPVLLIVDETFRGLDWQDKAEKTFYPFAANEKLRPYTIALNSFSKDLGPGIGFAFAYGPPELIKKIAPLDGPDYDTQRFAAAVFDPKYKTDLEAHRTKSVAFYKERYDALVKFVKEELNPALRKKFGGDDDYVKLVGKPDAGFHTALDFSGLRGAQFKDNGQDILLDTSAHLAIALMEKANVVAYPGEMFYMDGKDMILRVSLNLDKHMPGDCSKDPLIVALDRIKDFCLALEPPVRRQELAGSVVSIGR